jgi:hypothetical protein
MLSLLFGVKKQQQIYCTSLIFFDNNEPAEIKVLSLEIPKYISKQSRININHRRYTSLGLGILHFYFAESRLLFLLINSGNFSSLFCFTNSCERFLSVWDFISWELFS